ncbi:MAG TPA: hypothetical protein VH062_11875 [Polyangiaceae bacterium]|jgi:hypothetical protein|nr:hypothetical protein [Polyangiaceae bacterium]
MKGSTVQLAKLAKLVPRPGPLGAVALLLLASLVVAGSWLRAQDHFAPLFDLALTEMRVRDVGSVHTPLVGLPGRLGGAASHPGPLSFYLLAPLYRLLGGSFWALRISTLVLHATAIVSSLLIARRRAGTRGMLGVGVSLALLETGFGLLMLTEPWNPNLPVLWFLVFMLAVWSVADDDPWLLPVAAFAGSLCAQTHIPYLAVCGGLSPVALLAWGASFRRAKQHGSPVKRYPRSLLVAVITVAVLWAPPLLDELRNQPGNLSLLFDYFANSPAKLVGVTEAIRLVVAHLDVWHLVVDGTRQPGVLATSALHEHLPDAERGLVVLLVWAASAIRAWKAGGRALASLNVVLASALAVEVIALSRIIGDPWHYLLFSCWIVGALLFFATVWGLLAAPRARVAVSERRSLYVVLAAIAASALRLSLSVGGIGSSTPVASLQLANLAAQTTSALHDPRWYKADATYLVTWFDPLYGGAQGLGLLDAMERSGLRVLTTSEYGPLVLSHRVGTIKDATALVMLTGGDWVAEAGRIGGIKLIAYSDPRDSAGRKEFDASREVLGAALRKLGRDDVADRLGRRLSDAALVEDLHPFFRLTLTRMQELGIAAAVFVLPLPPHGQPSAAKADARRASDGL